MSPTKPAVAVLHRATIVDAGRRLFAENGFDGTTMDDIARAAGYSKRTVYTYVTGKADIQHSIVLDGFAGVLECERALVAAAVPIRAALGGVCDHLIALQENDPYVLASMLGYRAGEGLSATTDPVLTELARVDGELDAIVLQFVANAEQRGELRAGMDQERIAFALWAELTGLVSTVLTKEAYVRRRFGCTPREFLDEALDMLVHSIAAEDPHA